MHRAGHDCSAPRGNRLARCRVTRLHGWLSSANNRAYRMVVTRNHDVIDINAGSEVWNGYGLGQRAGYGGKTILIINVSRSGESIVIHHPQQQVGKLISTSSTTESILSTCRIRVIGRSIVLRGKDNRYSILTTSTATGWMCSAQI